MTFDYEGYDIKFIQRRICKDETDHKFTLIYKFYSPVTKYFYILNADYHKEDVFAIKFYCKKDKKSEHKYSKIVNRGDTGNILITCAKIIPKLLLEYPEASFVFAASSTFDNRTRSIESHVENQRFGIYSKIAFLKFGPKTFEHRQYPEISCYLLLNCKCKNPIEK